MKLNTASRTAQYMALFRAVESNRREKSRLFYDPFAISFLDRDLRLLANLSKIAILQDVIPTIIHLNGVGAISSGIARTKYIDDKLEMTVQEGIKQVIILGAGFDTRALRLESLKNIPVLEIDHPSTSNFKIVRLRTSFQYLPKKVSYCQANFQEQTLDEIADLYKINFDLPTTIIWEGVTNYLSVESVSQTFQFTRKFSESLSIIFTYIDKKVLEAPESFEGTQKLFKRLRQDEEVWSFGFLPEELPSYVKQYGLSLIEDLNATEYRKRYMPERKSISKGYEFYRIAFAKR